MDDSILCNNAKLGGVDLDDLKFDLPHAGSHSEEIALSDGAVGLSEVWGKEDIEKRAGETLNGIGDREDSNTFRLQGLVMRLELLL